MFAAIDVQGMSGEATTAMPELSATQFGQWSELLEQRLGIAVTAQRKAFIASKLRTRMRALGVTEFDRYYELVVSSTQGLQEWSRLLDLLTIHETRFNRQPAAFGLLEELVLPQLLQGDSSAINIKAWSVGCATGEEAYSLAIILDRAVRAHSGKAYYGVLGTDISLDSLSIARHGVYARERMAGLSERDRNRYFEPDGEDFRVREDLRRRVAFSQLNVQNLAAAPFEKMDVIFCQNLLIYFSTHKRFEIANALAGFLKPGGVLVLGVGEVVGWQAEGLEPLKIKDTLAYRKKKD